MYFPGVSDGLHQNVNERKLIRTLMYAPRVLEREKGTYLRAAFKKDEQASTRVFAAVRASATFCMSSSSASSKFCGTVILGNFL